MFTDKKTQAVAETVRKVMEADLSAKQKKIAVVAGDPKKIDAPDFKKLRGEEVEQIDEAPLRAVSALVGYPKLDKKVAAKGTPGSEDERNKAAAGLRKDRSGLGRRAYTGDQHYDVRREEVEQIDEAPMKSGAQSRREVDSVMDKYGFGSKQKEAPKSNTRAVAGKSYGADYKDPEGADDADDKKPEAGPKKSVKKGVFKRRYNTKAYTKESFTGLLNDYKDGGVKSLLESLEIVEVEGDEQIDESLDSIAKKHGMKYTTTAYGAGMKHPTKGEISINRYGEWHHKGTNKTGDSENSFSSLDKHLSTVKEEIEQMDEDEMTQKKKEKVVTVKHKDSGKELRVVKAAVADYQKRGYHPVKEEVEQIDERHLTDTETATKEHNVKSMKKNLSGFKERYGKDAKSVMYATATKQAKED